MTAASRLRKILYAWTSDNESYDVVQIGRGANKVVFTGTRAECMDYAKSKGRDIVFQSYSRRSQ